MKTRNLKSTVVPAVLACCVGSTAALATDLPNITLFGQEYAVQRFDYGSVQWPDPLDPNFNLQLLEVEGAHYLGNDRLLLSADGLDALLSYKNWVVEVQLVRDSSGKVTGLQYVRTVVINDPIDPNFGGFDLSPCGVTINTSTTGLGANGNLIIGDSEANRAVGYTLATGVQLGDWTGGIENPSWDDLAFVPTNSRVYTINEDGFALVSYTTAGSFIASTPIPGLTALNPTAIPGSPKGMTFIADTATAPAAIRRPGGTILVTLDDNNPGLQVFDLTGAVIATAPLTDNPVIGGVSLLDQGAGCTARLQLESAAYDAATGTIFLINEGNFTSCSGFYILTPLPSCDADFNGDGSVDFFDYLDFVAAFDAEDASADFNNDGSIDFFDYLDFVAAFDADC
jgi:hypothetical protein